MRGASLDELRARAEANNYIPGIRSTRDDAKASTTYNLTTIKSQDGVLQLYEQWREIYSHMEEPPPPVQKGSPAPSCSMLNDFLRFHAAVSKGRGKIDKDKRITADSCLSFMEYFYAGFQRLTDTMITDDDRQPVYSYIKTQFWQEGHVADIKKKKMLFTKADLDRFCRTFWTSDLEISMHPRNLAQFPFLLSVYTWTGARIGAFFPQRHNPHAGLRYKHIELVLERNNRVPWTAMYQINQVWVKNNKNPDASFGASTTQWAKLIYDDTHQLLAMAIADGAIRGIETLEQLRKLRIPDGHQNLVLAWNSSVLELPLLRKANMREGVTINPWPKAAFDRILKAVSQNAGYLQAPTVHAIRRALGKQVDAKYSFVERAQHLTQRDLKVFGDSYVANTSSVCGKSAFLGEDHRQGHIDFFQSFDRQREVGLPTKLPADRLRLIDQDEEYQKLTAQITILVHKIESAPQTPDSLTEKPMLEAALQTARVEAKSYKSRLTSQTLKEYQQDWVEKQRVLKVKDNDKFTTPTPRKAEVLDAMSYILSARKRLALAMISDSPADEEQRWRTIGDLHEVIVRDYAVIYLPGEEPVRGKCSFNQCSLDMVSLPETQRSSHAHSCFRKRMARELCREEFDIKYCYLCFTWIVEEEENAHCQKHIESLSSQRCNCGLSAASRLSSWMRSDKAKTHLEKHLSTMILPLKCPHPLCDSELLDQQAVMDHFQDEHHLRFGTTDTRRRPKASKALNIVTCRRNKRKVCDTNWDFADIGLENALLSQTVSPMDLCKSPDDIILLAKDTKFVSCNEEKLFSRFLDMDFVNSDSEKFADSTATTVQCSENESQEVSKVETQTDNTAVDMEALNEAMPRKRPRLILRVKPQQAQDALPDVVCTPESLSKPKQAGHKSLRPSSVKDRQLKARRASTRKVSGQKIKLRLRVSNRLR